jgi:hypothetical protein
VALSTDSLIAFSRSARSMVMVATGPTESYVTRASEATCASWLDSFDDHGHALAAANAHRFHSGSIGRRRFLL